jgi:dynein intermediate chain 2, axonemal
VLQFQGSQEGMCIDSYIWDVENSNVPDLTLAPPSPLVCLKYNPKDPHVIVAGCYNGLVGKIKKKGTKH